ncbi:hypothetical protein B0G82_2837 [Paraburkholderia sp. BL17N1]|nr:hypothetical protein B0G82_2837 [Paraburkholderia sp. BL17N1]
MSYARYCARCTGSDRTEAAWRTDPLLAGGKAKLYGRYPSKGSADPASIRPFARNFCVPSSRLAIEACPAGRANAHRYSKQAATDCGTRATANGRNEVGMAKQIHSPPQLFRPKQHCLPAQSLPGPISKLCPIGTIEGESVRETFCVTFRPVLVRVVDGEKDAFGTDGFNRALQILRREGSATRP